jgi:prepilin-type N-terminal cleavage/methylation domain-containing protein
MKPNCFAAWRAYTLIESLMVIAIIGILAAFGASGKEQIFLGPAGSGASSGGANWLTGANGTGFTVVDFDDPANGGFDFTLSNTVAGAENNADWRCPPFSLGAAAGGARPIIFSFAYKFVNAVARGNNMHVQLRFFDPTGTNFVAEDVIPVGARTGDSSMTSYRTLTFEGIIAPPKARTADIWINANIFEPWVSGTGRFDSFSVTTAPRSWLFKAGVIATVLTGIGALTVLLTCFWRRRAPAQQ